MGTIKKIIAGAALLGSLYFGGKAIQNAYNWHSFDKNVTKYVEVANGAVTAGKKEGVVSMEESLDTAYNNAQVWEGRNPAIIWETPYSDVNTFMVLTKKASQRAHDIGQLEEALKTGEVPKGATDLVKRSVESLRVNEIDSQLLKRLAYSEKGQTIASAYEALNDVIAGGSRVTGEKISTEDRSLVYILDRAGGWRAIIRAEADDYKTAAAHTKVALINANMGYLPEAVEDLQKAHAAIEKYPDSKNLSIWRDVATMNQGILEKSIISAADKFKEVDDTEASLKYSAGWWDRVSKLGESIGGDETPCLTDLADNISGRYATRFRWDIALLLSLGVLSGYCFLTRDDSHYKKLLKK